MSETPLDRTECSWCNGTGGDIHPDPETGEPGHCRHCDGTGKATPEMCDKLSPEGDSPDRWSRLTDKLESAETELAAATKRAEAAEQVNARLREVIRHIWVHTNGRKLGLSKLPADAMAAYQEIVKPLKDGLRFISNEANLHKGGPDA